MTNLHDLLDIRVAQAPWWTVLRYFDIIAGAFLLTYVAQNVTRRWKRIDFMRATFFTLFALFCVVQELEQLGQPVLVWRAPALAVLNIIALLIIFERGPTRQREMRLRNDEKPTERARHDHD